MEQSTTTARFKYHGSGGSLFGLVLGNALLTILTLGIYSAWAKNKVRDFHYSHTELDGDRFAYHGTGGELFRGALKAAAIMFVIAMILAVVTGLVPGAQTSPMTQSAITIGFYLVLGVLLTYAVNSARRYRLSRSSWRGIRLSYHGEWQEFLGLVARGVLLSVVTLGFYLPTFQNQRRAYLVNHARFGSEPFSYDGDGKDLFKEYLKALLLTIPTVGLYWIWYTAFKTRYFWGHTTMRGGRFQSTVTGTDLFLLSLTNALLTFFTLGIGATWAITRMHSFYCDRLTLVGTVDWASIQQRAQLAGTTGEGIADSFDVDIGIEM